MVMKQLQVLRSHGPRRISMHRQPESHHEVPESSNLQRSSLTTSFSERFEWICWYKHSLEWCLDSRRLAKVPFQRQVGSALKFKTGEACLAYRAAKQPGQEWQPPAAHRLDVWILYVLDWKRHFMKHSCCFGYLCCRFWWLEYIFQSYKCGWNSRQSMLRSWLHWKSGKRMDEVPMPQRVPSVVC